MTVEILAKETGLEILAGAKGINRECKGVYIGDLLSRVISRAVQGGAWITIMSNINVAAVAKLSDVSCVILAESVVPDKNLQEKCESEGIPLLSSEKDAYEIVCLMNKNGLAGS